ncbi:hypothetical protein BJ508DRAFT_419440 [Ascobolus immersus RN42]|uniref:Uncharacterized protein n=1 Tax=Ascobolus immersus RN42 TaxID=1160509 RepID=A0A3N4HDZ1_ASCIM|nr:hypothetical protein BJ508DRAFT_419440 [Ascobolus immersus RN42]
MFSKTAATAVRSVRTSAIPRARLNAPRVRYQSTKNTFETAQAGQSSQGGGSTVAAGLVGGLSGFAAIYAWYRFSGTAKVVEDARALQNKVDAVKKATPSPSAASSFIRSILESQLSAIPGAKAAFKTWDSIEEAHGDDFTEVISGTYNELWEAIEKGGDDVGKKVTEILTRRAKELKDITVDAGEQILDDYPQVKEKLGSSFAEVQRWGDQYGPEAKKQAKEVYGEVQKILEGGVSVDSVNRARKLIQDKSEEVKKLGSKAANESWKKGEEKAQDILKQYPEVKKVLDQYKDKITGGSLSVAAIPTLFKTVTGLKGDGKDAAEKVKSYIEETIEKGQKKGSNYFDSDLVSDTFQMAEKYIRAFPGGEKFLEETPDLKKLATIAQKKGPEAEKLARETWDEMRKVLEKKYQEAEKVAEDAKKEVKKESSKK